MFSVHLTDNQKTRFFEDYVYGVAASSLNLETLLRSLFYVY